MWGAIQGPLREAIHALKFRHKRGLGRALGSHMARAVGLAQLVGYSATSTSGSSAGAGYNQSYEIAYGLASVRRALG